jgi:predicted enzyme related to lactoylglutathione lyase
MNTIAYFEIQSSEPAKLAEFYKNVFGWEFTKDNLIPIDYYRTNVGGMNGAILQRPTQKPPIGGGTNAFTCSVEVESFDKTAKKIMDNGGIVAMAKFAIPGKCWQGYFMDSDNNVFGIFEVDESAK